MRTFKSLLLGVGMSILMAVTANAGVVCSIQDTYGNQLIYAFGPNSQHSMVETGFKKNGRAVISDVAHRPVWTYARSGDGWYTLSSQDAPAGC
jgi:hypothetical protein